MTDLSIRPRTDADLEAAGAALVDVYATDGYPVEGVADPVAWLTPAGLLSSWIAVLDDEIVGHVAIGAPKPDDDAVRLWLEQSDDTLDDVVVIGRLFVKSSARRHGIGEKLARAVVGDDAVRGKRIVLDVMDKDKDAIRLYERLGLKKIGVATHSFGEGQSITAYCYVVPEELTPAAE
ncbi:GNAT family N-acetyltransferase [Kribbella sandramycini]|uniref:GNAT family N-acetyltransferase n=1 Tax=Kribbella sandramycini TaxID=60450 RepID=A0A7Y4L7Q5_9ACTN|nr:GNAT family N-acetyltransferase [Kribbella sandramycini]MBB6564451.1 ribosomal protein S18 acetylase RimI-like enzyme [Kribbella sandramycini]NOL45907.1 GNAT family N-acetyltransferase [Kribbella sandramycini]